MELFDENGDYIPVLVDVVWIDNQTCPICGGSAKIKQLNRYQRGELVDIARWHICTNPDHEYGQLRHHDDGFYKEGDLLKVYHMPFHKGVCIDTSTYTIERIIKIHWDENYIISPMMTTRTIRAVLSDEDFSEKESFKNRIRKFDYNMEGVVRLSKRDD
jgi:hypothetical protein